MNCHLRSGVGRAQFSYLEMHGVPSLTSEKLSFLQAHTNHPPSQKAVSLPRKQGKTWLCWQRTEVGYFLCHFLASLCDVSKNVNSHHAVEWGLSGNDWAAFWQWPQGPISLRL